MFCHCHSFESWRFKIAIIANVVSQTNFTDWRSKTGLSYDLSQNNNYWRWMKISRVSHIKWIISRVGQAFLLVGLMYFCRSFFVFIQNVIQRRTLSNEKQTIVNRCVTFPQTLVCQTPPVSSAQGLVWKVSQISCYLFTSLSLQIWFFWIIFEILRTHVNTSEGIEWYRMVLGLSVCVFQHGLWFSD